MNDTCLETSLLQSIATVFSTLDADLMYNDSIAVWQGYSYLDLCLYSSRLGKNATPCSSSLRNCTVSQDDSRSFSGALLTVPLISTVPAPPTASFLIFSSAPGTSSLLPGNEPFLFLLAQTS